MYLKAIKMTKLKTFSILLGTIFFAVSCSEDSETPGGDSNDEDFTVEVATASLNTMSDDMHTDIVEMVNSEGTESLTDLVDLLSEDDIFSGRIDEKATSSQAIKERLKNFKKVFVPSSVLSVTEDDRFDFVSNLGVYNYNASIQEFEKSEEVVDDIQINFPTATSSTNNATLRILNYNDTKVVEDLEEIYYPTLILADLTVNDNIVVSLDYTGSFQVNGTPESVDVTLFVIPFDYVLTFSNTESLKSTIAFTVSKNDESVISTTATVTFKTQVKKLVSAVEGEITYRDHSIKGDVDVVGMEEFDETQTGDINDYFNIALYEGTNKVGDVILEETADGEDYDAYLVYEDGSKELLETVLSPVIDEIEDFVNQLEG